MNVMQVHVTAMPLALIYREAINVLVMLITVGMDLFAVCLWFRYSILAKCPFHIFSSEPIGSPETRAFILVALARVNMSHWFNINQ